MIRSANGNGRGGLLFRVLVLGLLVAAPAAAQGQTRITPVTATAQQQKPPDFRDDPEPPYAAWVESGRTDQRIEITIQRLGGGLPPLPGEEPRPRRTPDQGGEADAEMAQTFTVSVVEKPDFITGIRWESPQRVVFEPGEFEKTVMLVFDTAKKPPD